MNPIELVEAGLVLVVAVGIGTVVHELSHAAVLRAFDIPCDVEWLPGSDETGVLGAGVYGKWAAVTPRAVPDGLAPWRLRVAAIVPLVLAAPLALVPLGFVPNPFVTGNVALQAVVVGWLACSLPSPQDFSLFWHAETAIADYASDNRQRTG